MRRRGGKSRENPSGETPDVPVKWGRLIAYLRPYWKRLVVAFVALVLSSALSLVFPAVIQQVVDSVLVAGDAQLLNTITLVLLGVFLLRSLTQLIETYNVNLVGEKIVFDLRLELYGHLQDLSLGFYSTRRVGELISRLSNDVTQMRSGLTSNINTLLQQLLIAVGSLIIMIVINWRLTLFTIVLVPTVAILGTIFGRVLRRSSTEAQDELAGAITVASEVMQSIREVKSFTREPYELERFENSITRALKVAIRILRVRSLLGPLVTFIGFGGIAGILWFGGREALAGRLTGGELISYLIYALTIAGSLGSLISLYTSFQEALGATKRVFEILDTTPAIIDAPDATQFARVEGRIRFDHVSFSYETRQEVLHDVDLDIASRRDRRTGWSQRRGQEHDLQPDPALLRPDGGGRQHRRH